MQGCREGWGGALGWAGEGLGSFEPVVGLGPLVGVADSCQNQIIPGL